LDFTQSTVVNVPRHSEPKVIDPKTDKPSTVVTDRIRHLNQLWTQHSAHGYDGCIGWDSPDESNKRQDSSQEEIESEPPSRMVFLTGHHRVADFP
jgi:hypothetical protein